MVVKLEHKKINKMDEYYYFSIPKKLVDSHVLDLGVEYELSISKQAEVVQ